MPPAPPCEVLSLVMVGVKDWLPLLAVLLPPVSVLGPLVAELLPPVPLPPVPLPPVALLVEALLDELSKVIEGVLPVPLPEPRPTT